MDFPFSSSVCHNTLENIAIQAARPKGWSLFYNRTCFCWIFWALSSIWESSWSLLPNCWHLSALSFIPSSLSVIMILIPEWPITICLLFLHTLGMTPFMLVSGYLLHSSQTLPNLGSSLCGVASQQCSSLSLPTQPPQSPRCALLCSFLGLSKDSINQMPILQWVEVRPHISLCGLGVNLGPMEGYTGAFSKSESWYHHSGCRQCQNNESCLLCSFIKGTKGESVLFWHSCLHRNI